MFLFKNGSGLVICLCHFINDRRLLALHHFAHGHPVAGNDLERINRRIVRQRDTYTPSTYASAGFSKNWVTVVRIQEAP